MSNLIPKEKVTEVEQTADIMEVISSSVSLRKTGRNYVGLCPFHSEKTPSFTVSPEKRMFYCFGCGTGGNVIHFVMKQEGRSFPEAVRFLAGKYGIQIPSKAMTPVEKRRYSEREKILNVNRDAMQFFERQLKDSPAGKKARTYLVDKRGMNDEIIRRFHIGYAPPGWDNLISFFREKGVDGRFLEKTGLVLQRKSGNGYYDRFRERIIFPILDTGMRIIGFGGRVMDDTLPKYLNSPETPVFRKSRSLYGLNISKKACGQERKVFIVEGYFDFLALYQNGIKNGAATLGTALTVDHVRLLKRFVETAVVVFDSDAAGVKAAIRGADILLRENLDARVLILPDGCDPDLYMRKYGPGAFLTLSEKAKPVIGFLTDALLEKYGSGVDGKARTVSEIVVPLSQVRDEVALSLYIKELAERIGVRETVIFEKIRQRRNGGKNQGNHLPDGRMDPPAGPPGIRKKPVPALEGKHRIEEKIISMMLQYPDIIPEISDRNLLDRFENKKLQFLGSLLIDRNSGSDKGFSGVLHDIEDEQLKNIAVRLSLDNEEWAREGCMKLISQFESVRRTGDSLLSRIRAAEEEQDFTLLSVLLKQKQDMAIKRYRKPSI